MAASLQALGVQKGDRVLIYMPMVAEAAFAMLACARIGAIHSRGVWRLCVGLAGLAHRRRHAQASSSAPTPARAAARWWPTSRCWTRPSRCPATSPSAVLLVDRKLAAMNLVAGRDHLWGALRAETHGRRGALRMGRRHPPQLHAVHQRHHRQAQGRAARHRRLRRGAGRQHEAHLLRQRRRNLFLHQRHRLGGGPQLHHLRPADRRHGHHHVRGPADPARRRHLVEPGREVQGHRDVQRAHGGPGAQEAGSGPADQIRPVQPARAVPGRRAAGRADRAVDQRGPGQTHHRQLLADRNRLADPEHCQWRGEEAPASSAAPAWPCTATTSSCSTRTPAKN